MFTDVVNLDVENDNVVSTLSNVVHVNVEIRSVDSTLLEVVNFNVEIHNVVSTLIWRCPTSRRCIHQKTTLKQRWNVCWAVSILNTIDRKSITTNIQIYFWDRSRPAATSTMEHFVMIVNSWKPLTIITKSSTLNVAAVLDPLLIMKIFVYHSIDSEVFHL